jgi:lipopolysaccharide/colanic/teichoic acid biosynthesis glycosyltransferase
MQSEAISIFDKVSAKKIPATGLPLWKRILDCAIILILSPALMVVGAAVALLIKYGSQGPVLFRQQRVGYKGRLFLCYKFRTMRVDAKTDLHRNHTCELICAGAPMTKLDATGDPRLIPFGALLRVSGLDELPQLINVLLGEMSIVGPRPCIPYEYELYEPWQRQRLNAIPGLTGLWQVSGKNRTTFNQMVRFDIEYSEGSSLWLDLKIIAKTLPALWTQYMDTRALKKNATATVVTGKPVQSCNL